MQPRPTVSRRALLSTAAGCFGASFLLDSWLFDAAAAGAETKTWQQRWGDGTQRKYTPASLAPESLSEGWSTTVTDIEGSPTVECVGPDRVYVCGYDRIVAYDRTDGSRQWTYAADEGSFARPTFVDETVVVQENGQVHAIAADSGRARWRGSFSAPYRPFANPTARDGAVYLPTQQSSVRVDPSTGFHRDSVDTRLLGTLVAATADRLFWWADGTLRTTDLAGNVEWQRTFGRSFPPSSQTIAVTEECVALHRFSTGDNRTVTALDPDSGDPLWELDGQVGDGVAVAGGPETVYLGVGARLRAIDAATGSERWSLSTSTVSSAPVVTPETVYVPLDAGIAPVDPASGDRQTETVLGEQRTTSLAAVDGGLYGTTDEQLLAWGKP